MASSAAKTVDAYLAGLPPERRAVVSDVRSQVGAHMPPGYEEAMNWGMICWQVPLSRYPQTYNKQPLAYVALAAQKNGYSLYLMGVYGDAEQERKLRTAASAQGKPLDMGKSCLRFKRIDDLPMAAICGLIAGMSVDDYIAQHEHARQPGKSAKT